MYCCLGPFDQLDEIPRLLSRDEHLSQATQWIVDNAIGRRGDPGLLQMAEGLAIIHRVCDVMNARAMGLRYFLKCCPPSPSVTTTTRDGSPKNMVQHVEFTFGRTSCINLLFSDPTEPKHLGVESTAFVHLGRSACNGRNVQESGVHVESE